MAKDIYDKSVETRELQLLSFWNKSSHFGFVFFLLFIPIWMLSFHFISFLRNEPNFFREGEVWMIVIFPILAVIAYKVQKGRLKFSVVKTTLNRVQLKEILIAVAKKLEWEFISATDEVHIAKTTPGFFSGSWGEQITILFYEDSVFINSICDPNKRPSVFASGRNTENENTLIKKIKEVENQMDKESINTAT